MKMSGARRILKNILKEQVKCLNEKFDGERNGNSCLQKVMFMLVKLLVLNLSLIKQLVFICFNFCLFCHSGLLHTEVMLLSSLLLAWRTK